MIFQAIVDCRRRAAECRARAEITKDFVAKEQWNLFAKHWQHLADKGGSDEAMIRDLGDHPGMFDSEQIGMMSKAFDHAWVAVQASKASYAMGDDAEPARAALAKWIIAAAVGGELDPRRLSEGALADFTGVHKH